VGRGWLVVHPPVPTHSRRISLRGSGTSSSFRSSTMTKSWRSPRSEAVGRLHGQRSAAPHACRTCDHGFVECESQPDPGLSGLADALVHPASTTAELARDVVHLRAACRAGTDVLERMVGKLRLLPGAERRERACAGYCAAQAHGTRAGRQHRTAEGKTRASQLDVVRR
jgi:hypothetical protein